FLLIGILLAGYAILDGFDLGVGFWHLFARKDEERRIFLKTIGPVWDGNEVWLLTAGGALFAAFPPVYASVFSGFYLALVLLLLGLIFRVVSIEFRSQLEDPGWRSRWDLAFFLGSVLPSILFGVVLGNLVRGLPLNESGDYIGGFFALLNPYSLLVGVTGLAMFATHGALYLVLKTEGGLQGRARAWASRAWIVYLPLFLLSATWSLVAYQEGSILLPLAASLIALLAIVGIEVFNKAGAGGRAFLASAVSIAALFGAVGSTIFPNLVRASNGASLSLSIFNASASQKSLTILLIIALLGMPVVVGYTIFIYRTFAGPVRAEDVDGGY
ncbi:MAG: cytochrome d ubiquinol oxidase subunit II, partial [Deltaproteobacteria bacterium]|nr:cytochrome d ubiquinol oxidase subunit II [Deltaproteobacteria bacterium]